MDRNSEQMAQYIKDTYKYDPETGKIYWKDKHDSREVFKTKAGGGYFQGEVLGKKFYAHRVAWLLHYGSWPEGQVDHINGVREDNKIFNLRVVSHQENSKNQRVPKSNTSGVVGVHWSKRQLKWRGHIMLNKKEEHLGYFDNFDEAVAARKEAEEKYGFHENHGKRLTNH